MTSSKTSQLRLGETGQSESGDPFADTGTGLSRALGVVAYEVFRETLESLPCLGLHEEFEQRMVRLEFVTEMVNSVDPLWLRLVQTPDEGAKELEAAIAWRRERLKVG